MRDISIRGVHTTSRQMLLPTVANETKIPEIDTERTIKKKQNNKKTLCEQMSEQQWKLW